MFQPDTIVTECYWCAEAWPCTTRRETGAHARQDVGRRRAERIDVRGRAYTFGDLAERGRKDDER